MRKLSILVAAGLVQPLLTFSPAALADTTVSLPPIVISASRIEQPITSVGSSVVLLAADELRERGVKYVADALLEVPSLLVTSTGNRGSQTQIRMRGSEANHILILVDGIRMSDAATGEFDLTQMTLEGIEKIEVLMGPQSTLYGNDAAAGVISITTIKGKDGFKGNVNVTVGALGSRSTATQISDGYNGWHYMVATSNLTTDGISAANEKNGNSEKDGFEQEGYKLKAGYDHDSFQTWINFNQNDSAYEFDGWDGLNGVATDSTTNKQDQKTQGIAWTIAAPAINGRLKSQLQFSNTKNNTESDAGFGPSFRYTDRDVIDYQGSFVLSENHTLQYGAESTNESFRSASFKHDLSMTGAYLQLLSNFGSLDVSLSARSENHDNFGRHSTHRATLSYKLDSTWRIKSTYGTGFKTPTLTELHDATWGTNNPLLKPEESASAEVGLEYRTNNYYNSITLFKHETSNLIRSVGAWPNSQLENVNKADNTGIELTAGTSWGEFEVNSAFTWLDASETDTTGIESERLRVPKLASNITASYQLTNGRIWGQALYRDEILDIGANTVPDYWLFHIGASYDVTNNMTLSGRVENLADKDYEEIFSYGTRGRTGSVSVAWRF
ncbi:MAG: TonB-dependent receptor [Thiotrichaceae bacterium]|nr:TonB-dependent receptor [Thiotrichaceae bacterium]